MNGLSDGFHSRIYDGNCSESQILNLPLSGPVVLAYPLPSPFALPNKLGRESSCPFRTERAPIRYKMSLRRVSVETLLTWLPIFLAKLAKPAVAKPFGLSDSVLLPEQAQCLPFLPFLLSEAKIICSSPSSFRSSRPRPLHDRDILLSFQGSKSGRSLGCSVRGPT